MVPSARLKRPGKLDPYRKMVNRVSNGDTRSTHQCISWATRACKASGVTAEDGIGSPTFSPTRLNVGEPMSASAVTPEGLQARVAQLLR